MLSRIERSVSSFGGYYSDKLYRFKYDGAGQLCNLEHEPLHKAHWLVLARQHYFETYKDYPIASAKDLKQALKFEANDYPVTGITLQQIKRLDESSHRVTTWIIPNSLIDSLANRPILILPESYLLSKLNDYDIYCIESHSNTLFVANASNQLHSGLATPQISNAEMFCYMAGVAYKESGCLLVTSQQQWLSLLQQGFKKLVLSELTGFILRGTQDAKSQYPWKHAAIAAVFGGSIYLLGTSIWLATHNSYLAQQVEQHADQVNNALTLQKEYQSQLQWQQQLLQPLKTNESYFYAWRVMATVLQSGAKLTSMHYRDKTITLYGNAKKASDVLALIVKDEHVTQAQFTNSVRQVRNRENFSISFKFKSSTVK